MENKGENVSNGMAIWMWLIVMGLQESGWKNMRNQGGDAGSQGVN